MIDERDLFERAARRFDPPVDSLDRLLVRRERRQRSRRVATIVVALLIAAIGVLAALRSLGGAERQLPGNRIDRGNVHALEQAWSARLDGTPSDVHAPSLGLDRVYPPTVADGMVYVGSASGTLYAFDERCGEAAGRCSPAWTAPLGNPISDPPTVADGMVFVSVNGGGLYGFDEGCGTGGTRCSPVWVAETGHGMGSPVVSNGMVYGIDPVNGTLYAFRDDCASHGNTCRPAWTRLTEPTRATPSVLKWVDFRPAVADGVVYALGKGAHDRLYAFDASTGHRLWLADSTVPTTGNISPFDAPVVVGDEVFAMFGNGSEAFSTHCRPVGGRCRPTWVAPDAGAVADHGYLYGHPFSNFSTGRVVAYSLDCASGGATCQPTWTADAGGWGPVVASDGIVVAASYHGDAQAVDAYPEDCSDPCSALWTARVSEPRDPLIANGLVFVPTAAGEIDAFPTRCGTSGAVCEPIWTAHGISDQSSPPVIDGRRLFVATLDGHLNAFALPAPNARAGGSSSSGPSIAFYAGLAIAAALLLFARRRPARSA